MNRSVLETLVRHAEALTAESAAGAADGELLGRFVATRDESAFADFVRDFPPVVDDQTVLDFAMPRYVGSGFGLGQFNLRVQQDGHSTFSTVAERMRWYGSRRRPVVPLLTHLGGDAPETVAARIEAEAAAGTEHAKPIPEAEWRRW